MVFLNLIAASLYRYLQLRIKGDSKQWMCNLRTDSAHPSHLWQYRFRFNTPGEWETILIPFRDFVLTSQGHVQQLQYMMDRSSIKTVGFSVLGQDGDFSIEIDSINAINTRYTFGDRDILGEGQYIDEDGNLQEEQKSTQKEEHI